jgi:hypothetical protein
MSSRKMGVVLTVLGLTVAGCFDVGTNTSATVPLDPVKMQAYMTRNFSHVPNLTEALGRVVLAANGGHPAGVSYTQTANGIQGTVLVDVKGDGTDSATVNATVTYNNPSLGIAGGATAAITSITSNNLTGSANASIAIAGAGSILMFSSGAADLQYKNGPELVISSANLTVTMGTSLVTANSSGPITILGSADFSADSKTGTIFFESNGAGGWRIRVVSPNFATFTVP